MLQHTAAPEPTSTYTPLPASTESGQTLPDVKTEAIERLLANEMHKAQKRRRKQRIAWTAYGVTLTLFYYVMIVSQFTHVAKLYLFLLSCAGLIHSVLFLKSFFTNMASDIDFVTIAETGGVPALPIMLIHRENGNLPGTKKRLYPALTMLLMQVKASDALLLPEKHRAILRDNINFAASSHGRRMPEDHVLAALQALGQIGDEKAIPIVERLAKLRPRTARHDRLRQAALETLPLLHQRAGEMGESTTLLRAADAQVAQPETLLRPASEVTATPPDELLRPG